MHRNKNIIRGNGISDRAFDILANLFLGLFTLIIFYPLYFTVIASISDPDYIGLGEVVLLPKGLNFDGYIAVFQDNRIWTGYLNSFMYAILGTFFSVSFTLITAYPLSRASMKGRRPIMLLFTVTMFLSGGMIPSYIVIEKLGLINTVWSIVLPSAMSAYNLIITRTFLESSIPDALYESASIDGCGQGHFFFHILLPLSKPIIAVLVLFAVVLMWNQYLNPMLYLIDEELYPLQVILRSILVVNTDMSYVNMEDVEAMIEAMKLADKMKYSLIIVASLPVVCLYPLIQKHLVKGMMIGSVKE